MKIRCSQPSTACASRSRSSTPWSRPKLDFGHLMPRSRADRPGDPHLHFCIKNIRLIGIGGEAATAHSPPMKGLGKAQHQHPLGKIVTHRLVIDPAADAVRASMGDGGMELGIRNQGRGAVAPAVEAWTWPPL